MALGFTQSSPKPKTLEEAQTIINKLWIFCSDLLKKFEAQKDTIKFLKEKIGSLEEKLKTNSNNSLIPPSSDLFRRKKR